MLIYSNKNFGFHNFNLRSTTTRSLGIRTMTWCWKRHIVRVAIVSALLLLCSYNLFQWIRFRGQQGAAQPVPETDGDGTEAKSAEAPVPAECACEDAATKLAYDFCYQLPSKPSVRGKRFACESLEALKPLHLLDKFKPFIEKTKFKDDVVIVTAASENHFGETKRLIGRIQQLMPHQEVIFYDIGLSEDSRQEVKSFCNVIYREFKFSAYPGFVAHLNGYRWKPLAIAEVLLDYEALWWMDSSVVPMDRDFRSVYDLLRCKTGQLDERHLAALDKLNILSEERRHENKPFLLAAHKIYLYLAAVRRCDKFPLLLPIDAHHSIYSTTDKATYDFLPVESVEALKSITMHGATAQFIVRTQEVMTDIMKWNILCALEPQCMAPKGTTIYCDFENERYNRYANCHRYDQSVLNILLANKLNKTSYYWSAGWDEFLGVDRPSTIPEGLTSDYPKTC